MLKRLDPDLDCTAVHVERKGISMLDFSLQVLPLLQSPVDRNTVTQVVWLEVTKYQTLDLKYCNSGGFLSEDILSDDNEPRLYNSSHEVESPHHQLFTLMKKL